jgi:ATP-dependent exoDNAse (exonuclease V) beta subunit
MTALRPSDHEARLAALDPRRSFLVQAPAGSGKTELLTDRILALLSTVERPEEIVAITFTRKAAAEMHARVLGKLARGQGPEPEREHEQRSWQLARDALARDAEKGWQLLRHPARLSISTIDSFCAGLVRGMPWLSELGGMPGIVEDAGALYLSAARGAVELVDEFEPMRILLEHLDVDTQAACEAIAGMLGHRDQWMPLLEHGEDREALEAALAEAIAEDLELVAGFMPMGWQGSLREPARRAAAVLDETAADHKLAALRDWQDDVQADAAHLPRWQAVAHLLLTGTGGLRKTADKRLGFPPKSRHKDDFSAWLESVAGDAGRWTGLLDALRAVPPACFTDDQWRVLSAQLMVLRLAVAQLQLRFAETGEVDFIEIAQRAQRALGSADDPGELLLKLDASIRHLLVDEFQDTSLSQVRLLSTLTSGWQAGDGRTLFLVGDPMQSIYRFRKAEVGLFIEAAERGIGEIQPQFLSLTDNFRSQADVVAWVNETFGALLPPQSNAATGAIRYTGSRAFNAALAGPAVHFHIVHGAGGVEQANDAAERLTVGLARQALAERDPASRHPVAILVRARTHLGQLTRRLAQEGIACRAVDLVPLSRREVVADLAQLARALTHPADRMAWLSVLRAPWCGLTLDTLHALFGHDLRAPVPALLQEALRTQSAQRVLPADEYGRLVRAAGILLDGANRSGALPLAAWLESLWLRLGGAALYPDASAAEDAESLFLLIERLAPHGGLDPARFEAALEKLYAAPQAGEAQEGDAAQAPAAVEIMTMHKAKGLEFDTVILYGLHRIPRSNTAPLVRFEQRGGRVLLGPIKPRAEADADPLSKYLAQRDKRRADYEVDRLLYVAATRARHRLHLVGNVNVDADGKVKPPASSSLLARLWEAAPDACKEPPAGFDAGLSNADAAGPARAAPLRRLADDAVRDLSERAWPAGNPGFALSADRPRGQGWELWLSADQDDAAIGTLAHAWLARIGDDGMGRWPAAALRERLPLMRRQLTRAGVPASRAGEAAQAVLDTLLATLDDERGRWLLTQSGARREWPLIDAAGRVSVIDLALSTEDGWLVVDYKTGRPQPGESAEAYASRMRLRHGEQLERYCRYVTALDGRPARAALYFPRAGAWIEFRMTSNTAPS